MPRKKTKTTSKIYLDNSKKTGLNQRVQIKPSRLHFVVYLKLNGNFMLADLDVKTGVFRPHLTCSHHQKNKLSYVTLCLFPEKF